MNENEDLYEILQVHHAAEPEVIEAAYRRLLRMYHPDVNKTSQAHEITVRLNAAYEVLRDPAKRADYDRQRGSQTGYDRGQQQAEQERRERAERQAHAERERRTREERERREREAQAERERQEYEEWERQAKARAQARAEQERKRQRARAEEERKRQRERMSTQRLFHAVKNSDLELTRRLIISGADANVRDEDLNTPLHYAAEKGHNPIALTLIYAGADVNVKGRHYDTPLDNAVRGGHAEVVSTLISYGTDANAEDGEETPLHSAANGGHTETALALISAGMRVNTKNSDGFTPLHYAADSGHTETVSALISKGAFVDSKNNYLRASLSSGYWTSHTEYIHEGCTPLHYAAAGGHTETVSILISAGAHVDARDYYFRDKPLDYAAYDTKYESSYETPLHKASKNGHTETALTLISAGADVNAEDAYGRTPEDMAKGNYHTLTVVAISEQRTRIEQKQQIQAQAKKRRQQLIARAKKGQVHQLFQAVKEGDVETVMVFIDAGVDVNSTSGGSNFSLLHWAAWKGHTEIALALISAGADLERRVVGDTPYDLAVKAGHHQTATAIRRNSG